MDGEETATQRADEVVDELPEGSEGWGMVEDGSISELDPSGEDGDGDRVEGSNEADGSLDRKPAADVQPTKSDILGFVRDTDDDMDCENVFLPGERWGEGPSERYLELRLVQPNGRLTSSGACILCYASKVMSEAKTPKAGLLAELNTEGVEGFGRRAMDIEPEKIEEEDGFLDGLLES